MIPSSAPASAGPGLPAASAPGSTGTNNHSPVPSDLSTRELGLALGGAEFPVVVSPRATALKSSPSLATIWRLDHVPTHGGFKLADNPPCYELPGQCVFQAHLAWCSDARSNRLSGTSDARHYARYLIGHAGNGACFGRWS